jgi:hypothetical protein
MIRNPKQVYRMVICPINGWYPLTACSICEYNNGIHTNIDTSDTEVSCGYIAQYGNSVKEEERMNQLFCETTEELFCEITENLELTQKNKELFRIFLHSLDEEMRIFILNRLFVRRIAQNGEVRE